ncbi:MAG: glycosyl hydrolase, partial [Pyrinomonadaceae bacterium]
MNERRAPRRRRSPVNRRRFIAEAAASGVLFLGGAALKDGAASRGAVGSPESFSSFGWPAITAQCRPWTYWWWMGSAVDERNVSRLLTEYRRAGLGGVHIIPIYGARGFASRDLRFLTSRWIKALAHTCDAAKSLGMGVDLTTGTGWPFGGPWVTESDAAPLLLMERYTLESGGALPRAVRSAKQPHAKLATLMAYSAAGETLDLTARVNRERHLAWSAPGKGWTLYAVFEGRTGQQVKRAAPG